jgi:hypothetical protein
VDEDTARYYLEEAGGDLKQVFQMFGVSLLALFDCSPPFDEDVLCCDVTRCSCTPFTVLVWTQ